MTDVPETATKKNWPKGWIPRTGTRILLGWDNDPYLKKIRQSLRLNFWLMITDPDPTMSTTLGKNQLYDLEWFAAKKNMTDLKLLRLIMKARRDYWSFVTSSQKQGEDQADVDDVAAD